MGLEASKIFREIRNKYGLPNQADERSFSSSKTDLFLQEIRSEREEISSERAKIANCTDLVQNPL